MIKPKPIRIIYFAIVQILVVTNVFADAEEWEWAGLPADPVKWEELSNQEKRIIFIFLLSFILLARY